MRFPARKILVFAVCTVLLAGIAVSQKNNTPEAMLRAAMDKETVDGDLKAAIEQYKKVIAQKGASKDIVAKALVRLGGVYEKQGSAEARPMYERVIHEFSDQTDAVQEAQVRLAAIPSKTAGISLRQVCSGSDCEGRISPDGRYLSLVIDGGISVRDLTNGQIRQITKVPDGTLLANFLAWAPDSKRLSYSTAQRGTVGLGTADPLSQLQNIISSALATQQTAIVNVDGSGTRTVYRGGRPYGWSPDGKRLLVGTDAPPVTKLLWVGVADGVIQMLPTARNNLSRAAISPDGSYVAFNANKETGSALNVYVMASNGSGETIVSSSEARQEPVGWTPDGKYLLYSENFNLTNQTSLLAVPIKAGKAAFPVLVHRDSEGDSLSFLGVTQSGAVYYRMVTNTSEIFTASIDPATGKITSPPVPLPVPHGEPMWAPFWSPDGRRIAYFFGTAPLASPSARNQISIYSLDSGKNQQVASNIPPIRWKPCWASDGASLLLSVSLTSAVPEQFEPIRFNLSTGETTPLFPGAAFFRMTSCSAELISNYDIATLKVRNFKTGSETEIHKYAQRIGFIPFLSHDGRWVAFGEYLTDDVVVLFVVSTEGGPARELARVKSSDFLRPRSQAPNNLAWSPDDRFVYFVARADSKALSELFRVSVSGGNIESTGLKRPDLTGMDIATDGKHIVFSDGGLKQPEIWSMENFLPTLAAKK